MSPEMNHRSSSATPLQKTRLVVSRGNWSRRLNLFVRWRGGGGVERKWEELGKYMYMYMYVCVCVVCVHVCESVCVRENDCECE